MNAQNFIKLKEGYSAKLYRCPAGKLTIGYGHNIEDRGLRKDENELIFTNDYHEVCDELLRGMGAVYTVQNEARKAVLEGMVFQLGYPKFSGFVKMLSALASADYHAAAHEMLQSKWARLDTPKRAKQAAKMMKTGRFPE